MFNFTPSRNTFRRNRVPQHGIKSMRANYYWDTLAPKIEHVNAFYVNLKFPDFFQNFVFFCFFHRPFVFSSVFSVFSCFRRFFRISSTLKM